MSTSESAPAGDSTDDSSSDPAQTSEDDSTSAFVQAEIPSDFPDVVPLPKQKPIRAAHHSQDDINVWAIHYQDLDGPAEFDVVSQELLFRGFVEESQTSLEEGMRLAVYSNDDYVVNVSLLGGEGDQIMQIMVMNQVAP